MSELPVINVGQVMRTFSSAGHINISRAHKIVLLSVCAGAALLGIVAQYLKRRKTNPAFIRQKKRVTTSHSSAPPPLHSPDEGSMKGESPLRTLHRQASVLSTSAFSEKLSAVGLVPDATMLTPQQLGVMGGDSFHLDNE